MPLHGRIRSLTLCAYAVPYRAAIEWTTGGVEAAGQYLAARIEAEDGRIGVAEVHCKPAWNGVTPHALAAVIESVAWPVLRAEGLADVTAGHRLGRRLRDQGALACLLDNLCRDLWFAPDQTAPLPRVQAMAVLVRGTPEALALAAHEAVHNRGYTALKVKLGQGLEIDTAALQAVRAASGASVYLTADANGAYPRAEVAELAARAADCGVALLEDPCVIAPHRAGVAGLAGLPVPVVADRYCDSSAAAQAFCELGLRTLAAKPGRVGQTEAEAIARCAHGFGGQALVGLFGESMLGAVVQLRTAAAIGTQLPAETGFHDGLTRNFMRTPLKFQSGMHCLDAPPHLAEVVDWDALRGAANAVQVLED